MARGGRKPRRETGARGQPPAETTASETGDLLAAAAPPADSESESQVDASPEAGYARVGLPGGGAIVELDARPERPIMLDVPEPVAVTVVHEAGDLCFDLGEDGAIRLRGFLALHEQGRAPPLSVGGSALDPDRIEAALRAGEAQYGDGGAAAGAPENGHMTVVAVPAGDGIGVVGLLGPDGLAFEMPMLSQEQGLGADLPPLASDKVFALPEDTTAPHPIIGRLFDEDDPGAPTRYLSTTGSFRTAQGGSVMIGVDGLFEYRAPAGGFDGEDSFAFTVSDGVESQTATVTIVSAPVAAATEGPPARSQAEAAAADGPAEPGAPRLSYDTLQDSALEVGPERGLLADSFAAGRLAAQILSAGTIVTGEGGSVEMDADGAFAYMPPPGFVGPDHFAVTMESGEGDGEQLLAVDIQVAEAPAKPAPARSPRFALLEIPIAEEASHQDRATVTVALAESREVIRPAHYLALNYHDGRAWAPFPNGGLVPLTPGRPVLTLRALALDEAGNPLFQTPDAFEVAAMTPDGTDLIAGQPRCWLTGPAGGETDATGEQETDAGEAEPAPDPAVHYAYFDIPLADEDRAAGSVALQAIIETAEGETAEGETAEGFALQLDYLDGLAWRSLETGGVVPASGERLHVRAILTAPDGTARAVDPESVRFSMAAQTVRPAEPDDAATEGEADGEAETEIDLPLPAAPPGTRAFTLWATDEEAEAEQVDLAYWDEGVEGWHAVASGDAVPVPPGAEQLRLRLALKDADGRPIRADARRVHLEAIPVALPAPEEPSRPEPEQEQEPEQEPETGEERTEFLLEPTSAVLELEEAAVVTPTAPAEERPDFAFHGETADPIGGEPLPLAFDALAWAFPADADWPGPWRGVADAAAGRGSRAAEAGWHAPIPAEPPAAAPAPAAPPADFDPDETYALIFNIDVSGSMAWSFDGSQKPALIYEESRLGIAIEAVKKLLDLFVEEGFAGRTRVRIQPFTNRFVEDDAASFADLTDLSAIHRFLDGLFAGGITKYEPVMEAAAEWLADPANLGRYNRIYVLSDGGDTVGYQPISTTVRQLYTVYNGPDQPNLDIFAYGLGAGADELEPERLGALKTGKVMLDPLAPTDPGEKASVILVTAPENLAAVLADTAPSADPAARPKAGGPAGGVVMGREGEGDRPAGVVRNRLVLAWQLGDEGTITHPSISTVADFRLGNVGADPLASVADISGLLPASLARRPGDLGAYVQAGVRGRDLEIHVDVDGSIQGFQPQKIIILRGCAAAFSPEAESDSILKTLIESGNLVIASQQ